MSSPGSMKPASVEIHLVAVAVLVREQAALAVRDQHDHHRVGARKPFQPAGPALAPPAAVLDQRRAAAVAAAAGILVPLRQRACLAAQRQLLGRHDALHGKRAQVDDGPQLLDGAGHMAGAVLGDGECEMRHSPRRPRPETGHRRPAGRTRSSRSLENQASLASVRWALERITGFRSASTRKRAPGASSLDLRNSASLLLGPSRSSMSVGPTVGIQGLPDCWQDMSIPLAGVQRGLSRVPRRRYATVCGLQP